MYVYMYFYIDHGCAREMLQEGRVSYISLHFSQVPAFPLNTNDSDYS